MIPIKDNMPTDRFAFITFGLILANFVVYILAIRHGGSFFGGPAPSEEVRYGTIPYALTHSGVHCTLLAQRTEIGCGRGHISGTILTWETVFTAMFMHASIVHIAGNMIFLWIFGRSVEDSMGPVRFLVFYILAGLAALALQVAVAPNSTGPTLGASGAIAGVLGGYIVLYPRARVLTVVFILFFFTVIELPALVLLAVWFAEQAIFGAVGLTSPTAQGGVAYFAHVGGFAFGLLAIKRFATKRKQVPPRHVVR